jgi:hypothetical protein
MRFKDASVSDRDANSSARGYILSLDVLCHEVREAMLSGFEKRERAEEGKFALDQELRFKANARRNKLLGLWAAEQLGKTGEAASAYATEVVKADFEAPGDEDVFRKVRGDFDRAGVKLTDHQIQRQMAELMETAVTQVKAEKK